LTDERFVLRARSTCWRMCAHWRMGDFCLTDGRFFCALAALAGESARVGGRAGASALRQIVEIIQ